MAAGVMSWHTLWKSQNLQIQCVGSSLNRVGGWSLVIMYFAFAIKGSAWFHT